MERALIVGGGPAGMTAALALAQAGVECSIVELQRDWRPAGVGIGLQSAPLRATKALGLFDAIVRVARPHHEIVLAHADGERIGAMPQVNVNDPDDPPFVNMSRMALHELLERALRERGIGVRLGTTVDALDETADGVRATLSDGSVEEHDLVVGADGLHSKVRAMVSPHAPKPEYAGQVIWRMRLARGARPAAVARRPRRPDRRRRPHHHAAHGLRRGPRDRGLRRARRARPRRRRAVPARRAPGRAGFERCRVVVDGSLQLSRWEQEAGPPNPEAPALIGRALATLAEPI